MPITIYDAAQCIEDVRVTLAAAHDRCVDVLAALAQAAGGGCLHLERRSLATLGSGDAPARFMCIGDKGCGATIDGDGNVVDG